MLISGPRARLCVWAAVSIAVTATSVSGCGSAGEPAVRPDAATVVTSTTAIAGAGVLGNDRRPDESCPTEPARLDAGSGERAVRHAVGETRVPADPRRIVVLAGDQLDALCGLGLQDRIVAAALPDGSDTQPSYLGRVVHDVPGAGSRSDPDLAAIEAADPDLILGSQALTPQAYPALSAIAPTVFTGPPGVDWKANLRTVGAATGRFDAAGGLIEGFADAARRTGAENDAAHFQTSVVQLTDSTVRVYGADNFAGSVLAEVGLDRPEPQRFTDKPYQDLSTSDSPDYAIADGDIVYLSFASPDAREQAADVLGSDAWRELSATRDNRVFAVNNEVWQSGEGIVAARGILADLRWVNAPIN